MKSFVTTLSVSVKMLRRNRMYIITTLGLALISIFAFGWLFGQSNSYTLNLGVVNQDNSVISQSIVGGLQKNAALHVSTGTYAQEYALFQKGSLDAMLVIGPTFSNDLKNNNANLDVYYNQSNISTLGFTQGAVQQITDELNQHITNAPVPIHLTEKAYSVHTLSYIDFIVPGMIGLMLMWANLGAGTELVIWRQNGILKRLAATPLTSITLITAQTLSRLILSMIQSALLIAVGLYVFHVHNYGNWAALTATVALGALTMLAIGFIIGAFAKNQQTAQGISFLISFPMMFLGGSYFPTSNAPAFLTPVIQFLPLTHINDALRQIMNNGAAFSAYSTDLVVLAVWSVLGIAFAAAAFRWSQN